MGWSGYLRRTFRSEEIGLIVGEHRECRICASTHHDEPSEDFASEFRFTSTQIGNPGKDIITMLTFLDGPPS